MIISNWYPVITTMFNSQEGMIKKSIWSLTIGINPRLQNGVGNSNDAIGGQWILRQREKICNLSSKHKCSKRLYKKNPKS